MKNLIKYGVSVSIVDGELELSGLSKLGPDRYNEVIAYARDHKDSILREVETAQNRICPAKCRVTGKCYARAYFFREPGGPEDCNEDICPYLRLIEQEKIRLTEMESRLSEGRAPGVDT